MYALTVEGDFLLLFVLATAAVESRVSLEVEKKREISMTTEIVGTVVCDKVTLSGCTLVLLAKDTEEWHRRRTSKRADDDMAVSLSICHFFVCLKIYRAPDYLQH